MGYVVLSTNFVNLNFLSSISDKESFTICMEIHLQHYISYISILLYQGKSGFKNRQLPFMAVVCTVMLFIIYRTTKYQYHEEEVWHHKNYFELIIYHN